MNKSYFKIVAFLFFLLTYFSIDTANAEIYFITKPDIISSQKDSKPCFVLGYKLTSEDCQKQGLKLQDTCPSDNRYGKSCSCDAKNFTYDTSNCAAPKTPTGGVCEGKYEKCECDLNVYKYWSGGVACPSPKVYADPCMLNNNVRAYKTCSCPATYSQTCSGNLQGVGTPCDSKYTSCECTAEFKTCSNNKGAAGSKSCTDNSGTKYSSCQPETCESNGYKSSVPAGESCATISYNGLSCYHNCKCDPAKEVCRVDCAGVKTTCKSACQTSCQSNGTWVPTKLCSYPLFANEECTGDDLTPIGGSCGYVIPRAEENEGECTAWHCGVKKPNLDACISYCESLASSDSKCSSCKPITCINRLATPMSNEAMY